MPFWGVLDVSLAALMALCPGFFVGVLLTISEVHARYLMFVMSLWSLFVCFCPLGPVFCLFFAFLIKFGFLGFKAFFGCMDFLGVR